VLSGVWIGIDAGPPSIHVYDIELTTETGTMPGSLSAPIGTPPLGRFIKRNQFSKRGPGRVPFQRRSTFQNLLAGILILLRRPFRVDDEITTGEFTGTVEAIETRATIIRTYDGRRAIIPNGDVYTKPVIVISAYDMLRSEYDVGIGYGDDLTRAKTIALEAIKRVDGVLADPAPDVLVWELGDSAKNIRIRWWTKPARADVLRIRDGVLKEVAEAIANAGMDLPFPTQVVLFHDQTEETDGDRTRQREGWPAGKEPPKPRNSGNRD
jgi:small conductance mechanosensitive channel